MRKNILILTLVSTLMIGIPSAATASEMEPQASESIETPEITITVSQSTVYVNGANGMVLEVVSLTGRPITKVKIESPSQRVELNIPKGCYIIKVGKVVRKVAIR